MRSHSDQRHVESIAADTTSHAQKTGVPVQCVLPDFVVGALEAAPKSSEGHFFWTGKSKIHTAAKPLCSDEVFTQIGA